MGNGIVVCYYGDGKGKTTAALGLTLRASGYNRKILFAQFIKGSWKTGEDRGLSRHTNIDHKKFGLGFVGIEGDKISHRKHSVAAAKGIEYVKNNMARYDIIVLDEIHGAIEKKLIGEESVLEIIRSKKPTQTVILTGRPKIKSIIEMSDLTTQMKKIKHPFDSGVIAIKSIDW